MNSGLSGVIQMKAPNTNYSRPPQSPPLSAKVAAPEALSSSPGTQSKLTKALQCQCNFCINFLTQLTFFFSVKPILHNNLDVRENHLPTHTLENSLFPQLVSPCLQPSKPMSPLLQNNKMNQKY